MNFSFRVPPLPEYTAEVVLLITSLGVKRKEFNTSRQAMDLLEILRAHFKVIDFNIDTGGDEFGAGSKPDLDTVRRLYQSHRIKQSANDGMISLPQIIIDGVNIGDHLALQALADDGLLSGILKQEICAHCLKDRSREEYCYECKTLFQQVMPRRQTFEDLSARLRRQRIPFKKHILEDEDEEEEDDEVQQFGLAG